MFDSFARARYNWRPSLFNSFQALFVKSFVDFDLLAEVLDSIDDPFCVIDRLGRVRHENAAFRTKIERHPEPEHLRDEIRQLARRAIFSDWDESGRSDRPKLGRVAEFRSGQKNFRARASLMRDSSADPTALALVTLEVVDAADVSHALRARHRLTPREVQVVELLAEGHSNERVAQALGVSTHTARHHTGRVLSKLQAKGRAEVGALMRRLQK